MEFAISLDAISSRDESEVRRAVGLEAFKKWECLNREDGQPPGAFRERVGRAVHRSVARAVWR